MKQYKLIDVKVLGEEHPKYGFTYWCTAEGTDLNLRFSAKRPFAEGMEITAEHSEVRQGAKGDYLQLTSVKPLGEETGGSARTPKKEFTKDSAGITASMAYKLAFHAFVQIESMLPNKPAQWDVIEDTARQIFEGIERIKAPKPPLQSQTSLDDVSNQNQHLKEIFEEEL